MKSTYSPEYKKLINALAEARKERGITQQELADKLKKPQSFVSKFENGERRLDIVEFIQIARILKFNYRQII